MGSEHYCLRWNNHQNNLLGVFSQLLREESLVDVTLACSGGHSIRAHKVVLSACSSYFQALFLDHPSRHPIVILKDVHFSELRILVEFMYKGEVSVEYCQLSALLKTAESLKVKGLAEMTRDYNDDPEHIESKERTNKGLECQPSQSPTETQKQNNSPLSIQNLRVCKSPTENDRRCDNEKSTISLAHNLQPSQSECTSGNMTMDNSNILSETCSVMKNSVITGNLSSPIDCEAGPSIIMPPVQQVPLSLKKETDWIGGLDDKSSIDSPGEYSRHTHDSELESCAREDSPRLYPCMYCGSSFPHQSKLTRHILSHSLETLKYREQRQPHATSSSIHEPLNFLDLSGRIPTTPHEPPDPTDQPPTPMDMDLIEATANVTGVASSASGVVLCKFCGKTFPDVSSLISHLPVHTGDRPFKCEFCGKAFKLRHHMKDHCRVHTGERPFRCTLCGKTFSRSTILKAHEKTHYPKYVRKFLSPSPLDTEEESPHQS